MEIGYEHLRATRHPRAHRHRARCDRRRNPSLGEIVGTVVKWGAKQVGIDLDGAIQTAKDVGAAILKPIQLPF
jgi:hypothetical protein